MSKHERGEHMPQVVHPDGIGDASPYTSPLKSLVDTGDRLSLVGNDVFALALSLFFPKVLQKGRIDGNYSYFVGLPPEDRDLSFLEINVRPLQGKQL